MGKRMIDEFLARSMKPYNCKDFHTTMDVLSKQAFKMFLGATGECTNWEVDGKACSLIIKDNPLSDFVVLPAGYMNSLWYSNILCGLIRGSLEMINIKVKATFTKDMLRGDQETEIKV